MTFACVPIRMITLGVVRVESCNINLFFLYRFEAIFNWCFKAAYTIDMEPMWCHVSELQANFKAPTYDVMGGALTPMHKECVGSHPKMLLFALDRLSYVYQLLTTQTCCVSLRYLAVHPTQAWNGVTGGRSQSMIRMDLPCPMSTWGMLEDLRGLPGPFTMGCTSQEISPHFQAHVTGPASSTRL